MKKHFNKLSRVSLVIFLFLAFSALVYAANGGFDRYKIQTNGIVREVAGNTGRTNIEEHGVCRHVNSNTSGREIFVPTKSASEWSGFYSNIPSGIDLEDCGGPGCTNTEYEASGYSRRFAPTTEALSIGAVKQEAKTEMDTEAWPAALKTEASAVVDAATFSASQSGGVDCTANGWQCGTTKTYDVEVNSPYRPFTDYRINISKTICS